MFIIHVSDYLPFMFCVCGGGHHVIVKKKKLPFPEIFQESPLFYFILFFQLGDFNASQNNEV